jgi:hypothetical protein
MRVVDPQKKCAKSLQKSAFHEKVCRKSAKSSPDADFADSCRLLKKSEKVCTSLPPDVHTVTVLSLLLCVHQFRRRSLHFFCAVATASLSRGSASAGRSPNSIRSGLRYQSARSRRRQLGQALLSSAMAILVTMEQRTVTVQ